MKYKALFLDVDGTIVSYDKPMQENLPSHVVKKSIQEASEKLTVCFATGRPFFLMEHILEDLEINDGYLVINDGGQVIDLRTKNVLYERLMGKADMTDVIEILRKEKIDFFVNDNEQEKEYTHEYKPEKPYNIFAPLIYTEEKIDTAINRVSELSNIKANKTHGGHGKQFGMVISHAEATKMHGIFEVQKLLKVKREETIGVGDSGNDFPLLMACGLKIAMGNAMPGLKDIADKVAPSVGEDGVSWVINKYILDEKQN